MSKIIENHLNLRAIFAADPKFISSEFKLVGLGNIAVDDIDTPAITEKTHQLPERPRIE